MTPHVVLYKHLFQKIFKLFLGFHTIPPTTYSNFFFKDNFSGGWFADISEKARNCEELGCADCMMIQILQVYGFISLYL